jgi:hypothetical protein
MTAAHLRIVANMLSWPTANPFGSEQRINVGNRKTLQRLLTDLNQRRQARRRYVATSRAVLSIKYGDRFGRATSMGQRMARRQALLHRRMPSALAAAEGDVFTALQAPHCSKPFVAQPASFNLRGAFAATQVDRLTTDDVLGIRRNPRCVSSEALRASARNVDAGFTRGLPGL